MRALVVVVVAAVAADGARAADWAEAARADVFGRPLVVQNRSRGDSDVKEVRGLGSFDAPPWIIKNVVDDVGRYAEFMPYTKVAQVLATGEGFIVSYQRLAVPLASDRDYTIRIFDESIEDTQGRVIWKNRWSQANHLGPKADDDIVRIAVNEGYWQLEDLDGGKRTKVTYYVYTNPGGAVPTFMINAANTQAVPDLFRAVATAAKDPRYQKSKPTPRTRPTPATSTPTPTTTTTPTPTPTTTPATTTTPETP